LTMKTVLEMDRLTRAQKLRAMEELWDDLRRPEGELKSPAWHADVLRARNAALRAGTDEFVPWDKAKKILRVRAK
jgi:hypothetical protein